MKRLFAILAAAACCAVFAQGEYTVITNPAETASTAARINWHTDPGSGSRTCFYTELTDTAWQHARKATASRELVTAFDSLMSKLPNGEDCFERVRFDRNTVELQGLTPATDYMYRFSDDSGAPVRRFKTAPQDGPWTAAVISDFHSYTPLPKRLEAAMAMLDTLECVNGRDFDLVFHVGDVCAWGGSYSFWRELYSKPQFEKYLWAGLNGNHDNMDRKSTRLSNDYFRYTNNNPLNGYEGETGVCYFFRYGQALIIMLNNENMRSDEGLEAARQWVKKVISENPAKYIIVMEHYHRRPHIAVRTLARPIRRMWRRPGYRRQQPHLRPHQRHIPRRRNRRDDRHSLSPDPLLRQRAWPGHQGVDRQQGQDKIHLVGRPADSRRAAHARRRQQNHPYALRPQRHAPRQRRRPRQALTSTP